MAEGDATVVSEFNFHLTIQKYFSFIISQTEARLE